MWGGRIQRLSDEAKARIYEKRPELLPGLRFYLQAYMDLRFDRPIGMAVGYIPWTAIAHWGAVHGVQCPDELRVLARYVRALDAEEMAQAGQGGKGK